jgi:OFA family oxalate/formate antiporter-like MFS transporter
MKGFIVAEEKIKNRWLVVVGALLVQLCLGAIYAWGAFTGALQNPEGAYKYSASQTSWIFSAGLATFAVVMILAGRLQDKYGPRIIAVIGGLILGAGYIIAGFTGTSFALMLIFIGIVGGAGIGMGYVCPIAACVKWFPDLKGLITGLAVAGFGAGAFIFVKLAGSWMNLVATQGVNGTFLIFGIIFAVSVVIGALLLSNPPAGWKPAGWSPPVATDGTEKLEVRDLTQGQVVKTVQFWMIWLAFVFSAGCGLMVIKCLKNFGEFEGGLTTAAAGSALGLLALFNGLGRIVWGTLSQKLTAKRAVILMCILQGLMMFVLIKMGSSAFTLAIAGCWIGFNFGGNFALFPLLTLENFGGKNLGANYGAVFTSYGVGGILGPYMAGKIWDKMGTFKTAFIVAGIACLVATVLAFVLKPAKVQPVEAKAESGEPALSAKADKPLE